MYAKLPYLVKKAKFYLGKSHKIVYIRKVFLEMKTVK